MSRCGPSRDRDRAGSPWMRSPVTTVSRGSNARCHVEGSWDGRWRAWWEHSCSSRPWPWRSAAMRPTRGNQPRSRKTRVQSPPPLPSLRHRRNTPRSFRWRHCRVRTRRRKRTPLHDGRVRRRIMPWRIRPSHGELRASRRSAVSTGRVIPRRFRRSLHRLSRALAEIARTRTDTRSPALERVRSSSVSHRVWHGRGERAGRGEPRQSRATPRNPSLSGWPSRAMVDSRAKRERRQSRGRARFSS